MARRRAVRLGRIYKKAWPWLDHQYNTAYSVYVLIRIFQQKWGDRDIGVTAAKQLQDALFKSANHGSISFSSNPKRELDSQSDDDDKVHVRNSFDQDGLAHRDVSKHYRKHPRQLSLDAYKKRIRPKEPIIHRTKTRHIIQSRSRHKSVSVRPQSDSGRDHSKMMGARALKKAFDFH